MMRSLELTLLAKLKLYTPEQQFLIFPPSQPLETTILFFVSLTQKYFYEFDLYIWNYAVFVLQ